MGGLGGGTGRWGRIWAVADPARTVWHNTVHGPNLPKIWIVTGGHLPAALVTADRSAAVRALAEDRGVAVVTKPVKPAALRAAISGLAGQRVPVGKTLA